MKKIYISGKITGLDILDAKEFFGRAAHLIKEMGYTPVNPMEIVPYNPVWEWHDYMKEDIGLLLRCDSIFMLDNWKESKGAKLEHAIAKELGKEIFYSKTE